MGSNNQEQALAALHGVVTASEIRELYGVDVSVVRRACIEGAIPARKSGRTWLIRREDARARWGNRRS